MSSMRISNKRCPVKPSEMGLVVIDDVERKNPKAMTTALQKTKQPYVCLEKCARWTFVTTHEAVRHPEVIGSTPEALHGAAAWKRGLEIVTGLDPCGHPGESRGLHALKKALTSDHTQQLPQHRDSLRSCLNALIADTRTIRQYVGPYTNQSPQFIAAHTLACTLPRNPRVWLLGDEKDAMLDAAVALCRQRDTVTFMYDGPNFSWVLPELHRQKFYPVSFPLNPCLTCAQISEADLLLITEVIESPIITLWQTLADAKRPSLLWLPAQQPSWIPASGFKS